MEKQVPATTVGPVSAGCEDERRLDDSSQGSQGVPAESAEAEKEPGGVPADSQEKTVPKQSLVVVPKVLETQRHTSIGELSEALEEKYPEMEFIAVKSRWWHGRAVSFYFGSYPACHGVLMQRFQAYWKRSGARHKDGLGFGCIYCGKTKVWGI